MDDSERLESIRKNPTPTRDDIDFLLAYIDRQTKKNAILSRHVLELTEEMENVRMDFGGSR
jgi:hypothetical protein